MKPKIRIVDVPTGATAEETERLLNAACEQDYYVVALLPKKDGGQRAFLSTPPPWLEEL